MDLRETEDQARFRADVRAWLAEHMPRDSEPEDPAEKMTFLKSWQRKLFDGGWTGLAWPEQYGGRDLSVMDRLIWAEEYAHAQAPNLIHLSVGMSLVGPTLIGHGQPWQKERFLERILTGDEVWCQGFSEPNAGSDLASLRTRGEVRGETMIVTGQKIWTSFAHLSDWCILVVRTDPDSKRHKGLTFVLVDMRSPGIDIRPLREMTGESWFNEVFFDQVEVPMKNVVGEVGRGWDIVLTTLAHERGSSAQHAYLAAQVERLTALAKSLPGPDGTTANGTAADDPVYRQRLMEFAGQVMILRMTAYRNASAVMRDGVPGPEGSIMKLLWSALDQRVKDTAFEMLGARGLVPEGDALAVDDGFWAYELLWSRAATLYAGTSEIQRNIIATRVLGLPRQ